MSRRAFVERFGGIYEHSPWVAETAHDDGLDESDDTPEGLGAHFRRIVEAAAETDWLALLRAHPDLAGRLALAGQLTTDSTHEQASAGLDRCSPDELLRFQELNATYQQRFGFPFIIAVRGLDRVQILEAFERRVGNTPSAEFRTALDQVHRIAQLRLDALT
ncbi:MAG: 2-oxo-4-hydroxy-4-carboxy-5-ureidoimidazoline decarboxylase [Hyphomicrobiaceae bacterium]